MRPHLVSKGQQPFAEVSELRQSGCENRGAGHIGSRSASRFPVSFERQQTGYIEGVGAGQSRSQRRDCANAASTCCNGYPQRQEQALSVPKAPNGATWPTGAGYVNGYESRDFGGSVVNLVNQKTGNAFFVKLVSSARGVQFSSRHVYVGPNQQFSIVNVAPGDYYLAFQDLMSRKFYRTKDFSLTQGPSSVDAGRLRYTTIGFEFTGQGGGYEDAQQIPAADFGGR